MVRKERAKESDRRTNHTSNMTMIFLISAFLLGGLWKTEAVTVTGMLGGEVTIHCSHTFAFSNIKYFCKAACGNEDVLIRSSNNKKDSNGKYSIKDTGNTFHVTISRLTENDSGTYWCGIDRVGVDTYIEVRLSVIPGNRDPQDDAPKSNFKALSSKKLVYIGAGLGVTVLALAIILLIFFRHRKAASSGKDHDTAYATVSSQKQDEHHVTTSSTANEDQDTDSRINSSPPVQHQDTSRDHSDDVYSNVAVSSEAHIQPDGLFYSTVSFNKHTDCSTVTPRTAASTYSTIKHTATDESKIYHNV
ncbi:uncharacterized protein LOC121942485 [Plectropomus leopardus]|uniref:uncharacterized protein LOC121942485 n=1 Tax=Plectropomus leopardus TaxID=160734 RepID=UPI001C4B23B2|nr:uncharacterized protein LOC121942485 [Plectropomus leopardus]